MNDRSFAALKVPRLAAGCWPTPDQTLLLHAALSDQGTAIEAWRAWNEIHDLEREHIDIGSYRLMPLVYVNILRRNDELPHAKLIGGLYKRTWYENQLRLRACASVMKVLRDAGIETLVLKGQALALQYYGDLGARPMADIDILVPKRDSMKAVKMLVRMGWSPIVDRHLSEDCMKVCHAYTLRSAEGIEMDLHWSVLHFCQDELIHADFWEASIPLKSHDVDARALCPADQILHVCAHGLVWNLVPPIRWVADALTVLKVAGVSNDWDRLVRLSGPCNASLALHAALSYLRREFKADIPIEVIAKLEKTKTTLTQKRLYSAITHGGNWRNSRLHWLTFLLNHPFHGGRCTPLNFLTYLRVRMGFKNTWQVLVWASSRVVFRAARQIGIGYGLKR